MKAIRSHYLSRSISLGLIVVMMLSWVGPTVWAQAPPKTVLVLPAQVSAEEAPRDLAERAMGALALAIDERPGFDAMQFLPTSPSVRRAVSEGRVRQVDVQEGVQDVATALSIGAALKVDYVVLSTIQSFTITKEPPSVELIFSGQMYEVATNISPTTGEPVAEPKVFRAFGVSGTSTARAKYTGREAVLIQEALRDAAHKAAQTLSGVAVTGPIQAKKKTSEAYKYLLLGLILAGALIAISGEKSEGPAQPTPDALPPRNVTLEEQDGAIRISWEEPTGTTLTVLRYHIERAVDSGPFTRIDPGTLGPGSTFFLDVDTLSGRHIYQYRLRTVYTNGAVSPWAVSGAIVVTR